MIKRELEEASLLCRLQYNTARYLSLHDVEERLSERGVTVGYEAVRQ